MTRPREKTPLRDLTTYGRARAVRHPDCDYRTDIDVHLTICATQGEPFRDERLARLAANSVEFCSRTMAYTLYGYCLMPDHLHVLLSPAQSGRPIDEWLRRFKSFTSKEAGTLGAPVPLWQRSAYDHICREAETAEALLTYIVNNPVRKGLVECWQDWPWTRIFIDI